jgi:hypothetical protein
MDKIEVNAGQVEFGYSLIAALPYAYTLHLKNQLKSTVSGFDTSCLYYFSPDHTELDTPRSWNNMKKLWDKNFPNIKIHQSELDWENFNPPPLKEHYKAEKITFQKETIVIFNRYNLEWGDSPINYLSLDVLRKLFRLIQDEYQIVYINFSQVDERYYDTAKPIPLNDFDMIKKQFPKVVTIQELQKQYNISLNLLQCRLFAGCTKYISTNGGSLILSAYFGGENIIYSRQCKELHPEVNSFHRWYHKFGGGQFKQVDNYKDLIQLVTEKWIKKLPLINILIRTSGRPNYFAECIKSIYKQSYLNYQVIVGVDDKQSKQYAQPVKGRLIEYYVPDIYIDPPTTPFFGQAFKYNLYFNQLHKEVTHGFIMYLDDDDCLFNSRSLEQLANAIESDDELIFWRVQFPDGKLIPDDEHWEQEPTLFNVAGIGFAFNHKYAIDWTPYKRADYRVAHDLYHTIPTVVYLDEIITKVNRAVADGFGRRDDL